VRPGQRVRPVSTVIAPSGTWKTVATADSDQRRARAARRRGRAVCQVNRRPPSRTQDAVRVLDQRVAGLGGHAP
jgi:hypothetical protein